MFIASPSMTRPGVMLVEGGRNELGIERSLPFSKALEKEGCRHFGSAGKTLV